MSMVSVQVLPGPGIVARFGDVLVWLEEGEAGGRAVTGRVLDLARGLADGVDVGPVGGQLAEVLRSDPHAVPAMVLVAPSADGLKVVVHGWGRVLADGVDIDGGWVDRDLAWTTALAAGRGGDILRVPTPGSVLDLRSGSTPGGGAAVALASREAAVMASSPASSGPTAPSPAMPTPVASSPAMPTPAFPSSVMPTPASSSPTMPTPVPSAPAAAAASPAAVPAGSPAPSGPPTSFELVDLSSPPVRREPLPIGGRGGDAAAARASGVTVKGVVCSRGHFNNPIALFCESCGISMGQVTRILQDGIRPSLGTLVLDDGTAFGLDADHLVGSAPQHDPAVGPTVRPVVVPDPTGQVAPVHAEVRLVGWDTVLVPRAPTYVLAAGTQQWVPAAPGHPSLLAAGTRVAVGQRTFVVEAKAWSSAV